MFRNFTYCLAQEDRSSPLFTERMSLYVNRVNYLNKYVDRSYLKTTRRRSSTASSSSVTSGKRLPVQPVLHRTRATASRLCSRIPERVQYTSKEENFHAEGGMAPINQIRAEHPELFDVELETRIWEEAQKLRFDAEAGLIEWILRDFENSSLLAKTFSTTS